MVTAFKYYVGHQKELVEKYNNKVLAIKDEIILGVFNNEIEALTETTKTEELGTFIVHRVGPGKDNYSVEISTPVFVAA